MSTVQTNILSCNGLPSGFAGPATVCPASIDNNRDAAAYWAERGCYRVQTGVTVGSTRNSVEALIEPRFGGPLGRPTGYYRRSDLRPRRLNSALAIVPIGVIDIDPVSSPPLTRTAATMPWLRMVNIYGFFIEGMGDV